MSDVASGVVGTDAVRVILDRLVVQRQHLRADAADPGELEANRRSIAYWQAKLGAALAVEHRGSFGRR
jgi:hypothetical protein